VAVFELATIGMAILDTSDDWIIFSHTFCTPDRLDPVSVSWVGVVAVTADGLMPVTIGV